MTEAALFAFLLVFVRCSAMFLTSPMFSSPNMPLMVRILTTGAVAAALTMAIRPDMGPVPSSLFDLAAGVGRECLAGVLIGSFVTLAMQALQIAGGLMDLQSGLSASHAINPYFGGQTTVLSQLKSMLGIVVFLTADAHHMLIAAFVRSYKIIPSFGAIEHSMVTLTTDIFLIGVQIAAPVMAVGFLVDAALGLMAKAVPQVPAMQLGMPVKISAGLAAVCVGLPVTVVGTEAALHTAFNALQGLFR